MYGLNVGFEIARRALLSQQYAINITGHNIANANTPGFSRQNVIFNTMPPMYAHPDYGGTGVNVAEIRRLRSTFLDTQIRKEQQGLGRWGVLDQTWSQIEMIINEPSESGISEMMSEFWTAWQDLADSPFNLAAKNVVKEKAATLTSSFRHVSNQLSDMRDSLNEDIEIAVEEVNGYLNQLANLNDQIAKLEVGGAKANDLRDQRDYIIDQLSNYVNVSTQELKDGSTSIFIGSLAVVERDQVAPLETTTSYNDGVVVSTILWSATSNELKLTRGKLKGLVEARDEILPERVAQLDKLAKQIVESINAVHSVGYTGNGETGINFFDPNGITAATMDLSYDVKNDANKIAVSKNQKDGDNSNVLAILDLRKQLLMNDNSATFSDYYNGFIGEIGTRAQEATNMMDNHSLLLNQVEYHRQALQGVSLDEEMAKLVSYQHAYEAAAKVISIMDSALSTVINDI
ncbi:MAG: flagellar hook-associated protein FlgK [candidate division Zixibacteria bacterium]|nr:flagellar hook-associated protein FlgK [candidate division Zixibacteria bacterium]